MVRDNFPVSMCLTWIDSGEDCRGGIAALSLNGVQLNTSIYFMVSGRQLDRHSVSQLIEINPGQTAAIEYDGDMQFVSVYNNESLSPVLHSSKKIYQSTTSGSAEREEYDIAQLEHGGGDCNCFEVYFASSCTTQNFTDPDTR